MTKVSTNLGKVATTPKGEYNANTTYLKLDVVTYEGSSYVCLKESIGNIPTNTEYWQLLASKGANGQKGEDGYTPIKGVDYFTQQDIASLNIPRDTNDLTNGAGFITKLVDDLANYYLKSETYTKAEVNTLIGNIQQFHYEVVQTLPATGENNILYLVPKTTTETSNIYDEYVYSNGWEKIGDTQIDLSDYVKNTDYATTNKGGVIKLAEAYNVTIEQGGPLKGITNGYSTYETRSNNAFITKGTLENVIVGKGLVNSNDLASKQDVIDTTHKLDADLVDDTLSTNKFVSASDITNWNGKENVYYYVNSFSNPFVFDGKKKGIYLVSNFNTTFYYKMTDDSDLKSTTFSYVSRIEIPEDYNYDPNDTSKSAGRMYRYIFDGLSNITNLNYYYELNFNTNGALTYFNPIVLGRFLTDSNQSIVGVKTFSSLPKINSYTAPTSDTQFVPKKYVDDKVATKQNIIQYSTMPTASSSNLGKIVQFTGTTDSTYTNGYFYKCVSDEQSTPTYSWEQHSVQPGATGNYEVTTNKVSNITSSSTNTEYAGAKAVWDLVSALGEGFSGGRLTDYNVLYTYGKEFIFEGNNLGIYSTSGSTATQFRYKRKSTDNSYVTIQDVIPIMLIYYKNIENLVATEDIYFATLIEQGNNQYDTSGSGNLHIRHFYLDSNNAIQTVYVTLVNTKFINTSEQTIDGTKTFMSIPKQSNTIAPTNNQQFTNKKYVDDKIKATPTTYSGYDATKTQILKNINGVLTWVDEV